MAVKKKKKEPVRLNRLKMILAHKNVTQTELAKMIGKERNSISRICTNNTQPSLKLLYEISFALDVDVRDLLSPPEEVKESFPKEKKKGE
jgi:transcriptional regulator with XRE-family HTH domain